MKPQIEGGLDYIEKMVETKAINRYKSRENKTD